MASKGAWFLRILGKSPQLSSAACSPGMSSKQLLRIKEVPVEASTKLKQHDIITCKVNKKIINHFCVYGCSNTVMNSMDIIFLFATGFSQPLSFGADEQTKLHLPPVALSD